jgi:hypothetical protein
MISESDGVEILFQDALDRLTTWPDVAVTSYFASKTAR